MKAHLSFIAPHALSQKLQGRRRRVTIEALLSSSGMVPLPSSVERAMSGLRGACTVAPARRRWRACTLAPLPSGHKAKIQVGLAQSRSGSSDPTHSLSQKLQGQALSMRLALAVPCQRWHASPSKRKYKHKARLQFTERGLTLPSSGPAFGSPLKSNGTYLSPLEGPRLHFLPGKRRGQNRLSKCHSA